MCVIVLFLGKMDHTEYAGAVSDPRCSVVESDCTELQDYDIEDIQKILDTNLTRNSKLNSGVGSDLSQSCDPGNNGENKLDSSQSGDSRLNRTDFDIDPSHSGDSRLNRTDFDIDPSHSGDSILNRTDFDLDPSHSGDSRLNQTDNVDPSESGESRLNSENVIEPKQHGIPSISTGNIPDSIHLPITGNLLESNQLIHFHSNDSGISKLSTGDKNIVETRGHIEDGNGKSDKIGKCDENERSDAKTRTGANNTNNEDIKPDQGQTSEDDVKEEEAGERYRRPSYRSFVNESESKFDNARTVRFVSETNNNKLGRSNSTSDTESFHRPENGLLRQTTRMRMRRMSNTVFNGHYPNRKKTQTPLTPEVGLFND